MALLDRNGVKTMPGSITIPNHGSFNTLKKERSQIGRAHQKKKSLKKVQCWRKISEQNKTNDLGAIQIIRDTLGGGGGRQNVTWAYFLF